MRSAAICVLAIGLAFTCCQSVLGQGCVLNATYQRMLPGHTWHPDPADPGHLNLMMHAKLCNPEGCPPVFIYGFELQALGTGNDATDINRASVYLDTNCDETPDSPEFVGGTFPADDGTTQLCRTSNPYVLQPGQCVCLLFYYNMNPCATPGNYFQFRLKNVMGPGCQPLPVDLQLASTCKNIACCLKIEKTLASPADHDWTVGAGPLVNEMLDLKLTNTCCQMPLTLVCLKLEAAGTGSDATDIQNIVLWDDLNCNGKLDTGEMSWNCTPYTSNDGSVWVCPPAPGIVVPPLGSHCIGIGYQMRPSATCNGTFSFTVTDAQVTAGASAGCFFGLPVGSATKTVKCVTPCCLADSLASVVPDHTWVPDPENLGALNLMARIRVCNPMGCPTANLYGLRLGAGGTGNDSADIAAVQLFRDNDCDGYPDSATPYATGTYNANNGTVSLRGASPIQVQPGSCTCFLVYYIMNPAACPPVGATYSFNTSGALGAGGADLCMAPTVTSAVKTVGQRCVRIQKHANSPLDHAWIAPISGNPPVNEMLLLKLINENCETNGGERVLSCLTLQASGTGDDLADILNIVLWDDANCNGKLDVGETSWSYPAYPADNGTVTICPNFNVGPLGMRCLGIGYLMKPTAQCDKTYQFSVTNVVVKGTDGSVQCWTGSMPVNSATKTVRCPPPCCLEVFTGPANPGDHQWDPCDPALNEMLQIRVVNPCPTSAIVKCLTLQASGTGDDAADIEGVDVYIDSNCNGKVDAGESTLGSGSYPADDGSVTICGSTNIAPGGSLCLLVAYRMKSTAPPGSTYKVCLTALTAREAAGGDKCVHLNLPEGQNSICSGTKTRCWLIGEAKDASIGTPVCLHNKISTARFSDRFYIEEKNRPSGIGVLTSHYSFFVTGGQECSVYGVTALPSPGCELMIIPTELASFGDHATVTPVGMIGRTVGGLVSGHQPGIAFDCCGTPAPPADLNNIGLLVRVWGRVTYVSAPCFWVDDGTGRSDGTRDPATGNCVAGICVNATQAFLPAVGNYAAVTGISRTQSNQSGGCIPVVWPRQDVDIVRF